jgi:hypothetical protein
VLQGRQYFGGQIQVTGNMGTDDLKRHGGNISDGNHSDTMSFGVHEFNTDEDADVVLIPLNPGVLGLRISF